MPISFLVRASVVTLLALGATSDSPVAKVITLLEDLKTEVESDGKKEATAYGEFACFCKDTSDEKSTSVTDGSDKIDSLSASIQESTAEKGEKEAEVEKRKADQEKLHVELGATVARHAKAKADFERNAADTKKAISSLEKAIKAMNAAKESVKSSKFLQLNEDVQYSLILAYARHLVSSSKRSAVNAFLQGGTALDPSDPAYKYHSKEINEILAKLLGDFKDDQKETEEEFKKTDKAISEEQDGLATKMRDNLDAIANSEDMIEDLKKKIAKDREDLISAQDTLKDDETYLKDLTSQCEEKAKDFDQRAQMRGAEIKALTQALKIVGGKAKENEDVGKDVGKKKAFVQKVKARSKVGVVRPLSLLQSLPSQTATNFLTTKLSTSQQKAREQVLSLLRIEGKRLDSPMISALVMNVAEEPTYTNFEDPFKKAKMLIQKLIERLLEEGHAEAAKKGFCDEEIGKGTTARDFAYDESKALHADLKELEATKESLESEMKHLKKGIEKTEKSLKEATNLREKEHKENMEVVEKATEGLEAVKEAILILRAFYQSAGNAHVFLQASPVDAPETGFDGGYKGKQEESRPIFDLLQKISDNFQATIDKTEKSEEEAAADYVKFDRNSKADIGGKETKTRLDEQDLKSTETSIEKKLDDLKIQTGLMDDALKLFEELKPACVDTGMNYQERVEKRQEEIKALEHALEILREA